MDDAGAAAPAARTIRVGEIDLRVLDQGEGPAVVLLHGFPDRAEEWRHVATLLRAGGRRTIAPDLRGFGDSSAPGARAAYRIDRVLGDLDGLLDALGLSAAPIDVVGHDWGAVVGWAWCLQRPDRIRRFVAVSVGHPSAYLRAGLEQKRKGLYMLVCQVPWITERLLARDGWRRLRAFMSASPDLEREIADLSRPGRLTAGLNWYRANVFSGVRRRLPRCRVPTLGVWSSGDRYLAEDQMRDSDRHMDAEWRYERLDGVGHWIPLQAPDRLAELTLEWLDGRPAAVHGSASA
ncbi:MAG: alpha/beta fold hydrolase [Solirubrobacteraceae bacterium]